MIRKFFIGVLLLFIIFSFIFYYLQNNYYAHLGGQIALTKSIWLFLAIFYWFCLPIFVVINKSSEVTFRWIYGIFLMNMLARGIIELFMMYQGHNWSYYLGLGHDVFSIFLIGIMLWLASYKNLTKHILYSNLWVITCMFIVEIGFVEYMLHSIAQDGKQIYYVANDGQHSIILMLTWIVNILLIFWQVNFINRWFSNESKMCYLSKR